MRYIGILIIATAGLGLAQVNGQVASGGETATFTLKINKVPADVPLTATPTCNVAKDPDGGYPVKISGPGIVCTVTISKPAPASGATVTVSSTDPTIVMTPSTISIAVGNNFGTFRVTATP